jgi:hypothetical protein
MLRIVPPNGMISQGELTAIVTLTNKIAALVEARNRCLVSVLNRLAAGAEVEPGTHYAVLLERISHGHKRLWVEVK